MESKVLISADEPNTFSLGPVGSDNPLHVINIKHLALPVVAAEQSLDGWSLSFRGWPTLLTGWRDWYARVSAEKSQV